MLGRRIVPAALILSLTAGCPASQGPSTTKPRPRTPVAGPATHSFGPAWTDAERAAARQAVLQHVGDAGDQGADDNAVRGADLPPFTAPIARQHIETNTFMALYGDRHPIKEGAVGERVEVHDSWLDRGPWTEIKDGRLHVRFEALRPVGPVRLTLGVELWGERFGERVYRHMVRSNRGQARNFDLSYPLASLVADKYDVTKVQARGRGVVVYRVEALDAEGHRMRVEEGRVAFECNKPCDSTSEFSPLPTVVLGPFVDQVTPTSAVISFETDRVTRGAVQIRSPDGAPRMVHTSTRGARRHELTVTGLKPGTSYRYLALASDDGGRVVDEPYGTFRTSRPGQNRFRFVVLSDSRSAPGGEGRDYNGVNRHVLERLLLRAAHERVDFAIFAGDLIDGYVTVPAAYRRQLRAWMESVTPFHMHVPIYEAMGNHEMLGDAWSEGWMVDRAGGLNSETLFAEAVVNPTNGPPTEDGKPPYTESVYSFDFGTAHFAVVNSNHWTRNRFDRSDHPGLPRGQREGMLSGAQLDWLDADLSAASKRGQVHLFVVTHEPAFPTGGHVRDAMYYEGKIPEVLEMRDRFWGLLVKHSVVAAFFGDEHNYSRTMIGPHLDPKYARRVWQVVTGGAGAPYYAQDYSVPWKSSVKAFAADHHFVLVTVESDLVRLEAISLRGEVIDRAVLRSPTGTSSQPASPAASAPR